MGRGFFFTFDGLDGTGKSTQAALFCSWLRERGQTVVTCRDPGTTAVGERLRAILLEQSDSAHVGKQLDPRTETLLYMAARAQLVAEVIHPALAAGKTVVSDRFVLANVVYQAHGLGISPEEVWELNRFPTQGIEPDGTIVLDMDVQRADARRDGEADRMEERDLAYRNRVRDGFLAEAAKRPERILVVDADADVDTVQQRIRDGITQQLEIRL